jgi:hypothetical protein
MRPPITGNMGGWSWLGRVLRVQPFASDHPAY